MLNKTWSEEEIEFLCINYPKYGNKYCSEHLVRSTAAIKKMAKNLKIKFLKIKEIYFEENFRPIVEKSKSIGEILDNIGLRKAGGNYLVINKYINLYKIDISHFETIKDRHKKMIESFVKRPIEEYLVKGRSCHSSSLKKRLYKEGYFIPVCSICGQGENWHGVKISLILDHINGEHSDNRIENLRIVCPNCNAGLSTFAGRNKETKNSEG